MTVELGEACDIEYGKRIMQKGDTASLYPVYGSGESTFSTDTYNREDCTVIARFAMKRQCTRYVKGKFYLNDSGLTLRSKMGSLRQDYLNWQILALNNKTYQLGIGIAQRNLDIELYLHIKLRVPTIEKQSAIVQELNLIQSIIDNKNCQIRELDKLSLATFNEMFGDVGKYRLVNYRKLHSLCTINGRGGSNGYSKDDYVDSNLLGAMSISPTNIIDNELGFEGCKYVSWDKYNQSSDLQLRENDIILAKKGEYFEQYAIVSSLPHEATINPQLIMLRSLDLNPTYLAHFLLTPYARKQYQENAGNTARTFSLRGLRMVSVYIPPKEQQMLFEERIKSIKKTRRIIKDSLFKAESLLRNRMMIHFQ